MPVKTAVLEAAAATVAVEELDNQDALLSVADDLLDLVTAHLPRGNPQAHALAIAAAAAAVQNGVPLRTVKAAIDEWGAA